MKPSGQARGRNRSREARSLLVGEACDERAAKPAAKPQYLLPAAKACRNRSSAAKTAVSEARSRLAAKPMKPTAKPVAKPVVSSARSRACCEACVAKLAAKPARTPVMNPQARHPVSAAKSAATPAPWQPPSASLRSRVAMAFSFPDLEAPPYMLFCKLPTAPAVWCLPVCADVPLQARSQASALVIWLPGLQSGLGQGRPGRVAVFVRL